MDSLYHTDALAWAEQQVALLRRLAAGERLIEAVDWDNVIEEVGDVGLSLLRACETLLQQAMANLLKLHAWPASQSAEQWLEKTGFCLNDAELRFAPSMRQQISLDQLYGKALRRVRQTTDGTGAPRSLPEACPFTIDELLAGDVQQLGAKMAAAAATTPPS